MNRLTVQTYCTPAEFQARYEEAVPPLPAGQVAALVQRHAPWQEMLDLVAAAAPYGFLIYFKNDVDPVVRLAGDRFILSTSGHIAAMVNPPGNGKARYQVAKDWPEDPQEWLRHAETAHDSWWPDFAGWLAERCGEEKATPGEPGGGGLMPICDTPGTYVYDH